MTGKTHASQAMLDLVMRTLADVMRENGHEPKDLVPGTNILHDTPLDSMGLAVAVLRLEDETHKDPFQDGFKLFQTVEELALLYDD